MNRRRWLFVAGGGLGCILVLVMLTLFLLPSRELLSVAQRALAEQGLTLKAESVGKAFPLGVTAHQVVITSPQGSLFAADKLTCRLHLLPLLLGRLQWSATADLGNGSLAFEGTLGKQPEMTVASHGDLRLERLPILQMALGGRVEGTFSIQGTIHGAWPTVNGALTLDALAVDMKEIDLGGIRLPDAVYRTMRGQFVLDDGTATLQSFALEGDGIYGRLQGTFSIANPVTSSPLDLRLQLMPKADFIERQKGVFLLLSRFMASPGSYEIPVKGTIAAPTILQEHD